MNNDTLVTSYKGSFNKSFSYRALQACQRNEDNSLNTGSIQY